MMDNKELFLSCRRGDLSKITYLVEQKEVDVNIRDKWDSTPLYYACLCGHEDVVKYLLETGARCEPNTFDGERCLYGALTDKIKKLLQSYNMVSSKVMRRDLYEEFLRRLKESGLYHDVVFHVHGEKILAHRCVLSARSSYFAELFRTKWKGRRDVILKHKLILPSAFKGVLDYLYTGQMEIHVDNIADCVRLARQCKLVTLIQLIEEKQKKLESFESTKPGVNITMLLVEQSDKWQLQLQFGHLADLALPSELCSIGAGELPFEPEFAPIYADIVLMVEGHKFYCHKVFFCGRSDYFKALLQDHFGETSTSDENLPVLNVHGIGVNIFVHVLYYLYQNSCEVLGTLWKGLSEALLMSIHNLRLRGEIRNLICGDPSSLELWIDPLIWSYDSRSKKQAIRAQVIRVGLLRSLVLFTQPTEEEVYDLMCAADLYLLPGLKRQCANVVAQYLQVNNVVMVIKTARLFNLPRLEDQCAEFMAENIEKVLELQEFAQLVQDDATEVESREETDTIDIIDSIRFHLTNFVQTYSELQEMEEKIKLIDKFLESVGLEA